MCDRIETLDDEIHAFVAESVAETRISAQLARLENERRDRQFRPPLYGVPVALKDVFRADGFPTKAGSSLPTELLDGPESAVVRALRDLGAVVVGKTVTTEFTHLPTGETRNPHAVDHTPGGSSSGSAAAVAAGMCPLALGSETTGSVIRPAAFCGVVGFRPTTGRLPTEGLISLAPTADTVGLFTQDLEGVRRVASLLCTNWTTRRRPGSLPTIGVPTGPYLDQASQAAIRRFRAQVSSLESAGFEVERMRFFDDIQEINTLHDALLAAEAAGVHAEWYTRYPARYSAEMAELVARGDDVSVETLGRAKRSMKRTRASVESAFASADLDVIVAPPAPSVAPEGLDDDGDPVMNLPWTHAGVPTVTLPVGSTDAGLPYGIACIGRFGRDEGLLSHSRTIDEQFRDTSD
ncbi:amidase [Haloarcula sp. S1CR25-12]|uniref:Amidase n=1 Tax=Haloarcula saliterrae TaxID=2950534 RepID=A0ABU2FFX3_9EURY|nr:amidase [Haloarcula sp. S1CR25-12]MDS0261144.1 amidase [Haloarcula sp. S1CR25-12]